MIVTIDLPNERIIIDAKRQAVKCIDIDGGGQPFGTVREGTIGRLISEIEREQKRRDTARTQT